MSFTVAIVGRPNVGKSTLFNRLVGKRLALVHDRPGVTRDRREGDARLFHLRFRLFDTAGLEEADAGSMEGRMRAQTERAVAEADLALFLIDARAGITPMDRHFADLLRKSRTPIVLLANKVEGKAAEAGLYEAYALGLGEPIPVSAEHGLGLGDLLEALTLYAPEEEPNLDEMLRDAGLGEIKPIALQPETEPPNSATPEDDKRAPADPDRRPLQIAIVGRPNVGKSTLINRLLGADRLLTGPEAGITRDAIAIDWRWQGRAVKLIDTAGMRRKAKATESLERLSVSDTLRAIRFAHVVVLVLDANDMLEKQDLTIARLVIGEGRAVVLAANKWDATPDRSEAIGRLRDRMQMSLPQVKGIPYVTVSAKRGRNLDALLRAAIEAYDVWNRRIGTSRLNRWLGEAVEMHPPPAPGGRRLKLRYMTQAKTRPPTFALFCSRPGAVPDSYLRYLENALREDFDLPGVPIRINLRKTRNPYADDPS